MPTYASYAPLPQCECDDISEDCTVSFCSPLYYAMEGEDTCVNIDVIRFGNLDKTVAVSYYTQDGSALAGVKYRAASGIAVLRPGETYTTIAVEVIDDDVWNTALEFKVFLANPVSCILGDGGSMCRVKVMDDDSFPSNRFTPKEGEEGEDEMPGLDMLRDYLTLNFYKWNIRWRTLLVLFLDQIHNAYFLLSTYLNVYLIDVVFSQEEESAEELLIPDDRIQTAMVCAALYVIPVALLHFIDTIKVMLDLDGLSAEFLQTSLFRKYLNYSDAARTKVDTSAMSLAVISDCPEIALAGYMKCIGLFRVLGKLMILCVFVYKEHKEAVWAMIVFPLVMILWMFSRVGKQVRTAEHVKQQESAVVRDAHSTCHCYSLVADYKQRPMMYDRFAEKIHVLTNKKRTQVLGRQNSVYFIVWLSKILVGGYMVLFAESVLSGKVSLGTFLALIKIFQELSAEFSEAYTECLEILHSLGPLEKITSFLNAQADLKDMRSWHHRMQQSMHQVAVYDDASIVVENLAFRYANEGDWLIRTDYMEVPQGTMVAVIGPHTGGKSTMLQLLTQHIFPQEGEIFFPTHLAVLNVGKIPMLLESTLWDNLVFGNSSCSPGRVCRVLSRLGIYTALDILDKQVRGEMNKDDVVLWKSGSQALRRH